MSRFCGKCGTLQRTLFNLQPSCPYGCVADPPPPTFPDWWSAYAGPYRWLKTGPNIGQEDLLKWADVVLLYNVEGKLWNGTGVLREVTVYRNRTWDSTVGKTFGCSPREAAVILQYYEVAPEELGKRLGKQYMGCLVRAD